MSPKFPIQAGSDRDQILRVQKALGIEPTAIYGPTTTRIVADFQRIHQLPQTGLVDAKTWDQLFAPEAETIAPSPTLRSAVLGIAQSQLHIREAPPYKNRGPQVDIYNATAGTAPGSHWCLSFVFWCCQQAATRLKAPVPIPRSAYCPYLHSWAAQNGRLTLSPQPGDIFLVRQLIDGKYWATHTGFVLGSDPKDKARVLTIEGNTNDNGSSNGIGVFQRSRRRDSLWFVSLG